LNWTSNLDGVLGSGNSLSVTTLTPGTHTITAAVTDSGGLDGSAAVTLTIVPAGGTIVTLADLQDSFTRGESPNSQHGTRTYMRVKAAGEKVGFAAFDLSNLNGTVNSAVLKLYVQDLPAPGILQVHAVTTAWTETSITHNTRPAITAPLTTETISESQLGTSIEIDITAIVQSWIDSPLTAHGIALTAADSLHVLFDTRESVNAPSIEVSIIASP
jgi:hypothetical protein